MRRGPFPVHSGSVAWGARTPAPGLRMLLTLTAGALLILPGLRTPAQPAIPAATGSDVRTVSISAFLDSARSWGEGARVRVSGVVTHTISDHTYFIQEGGAGVYIFQKPDPAFQVGDRVEVTGNPSLGGVVPTLQNCIARVTGTGALPEPEPITGAEALNSRHAMTRVRIRGRLVENRLMGGRLMVLHPLDDTQSIQVNLEGLVDPGLFEATESGSLLEVTGVLVIRESPNKIPSGATILVRTAGDISLIQGPPFWTVRRIGRILGGTGVALLIALAWIVTLRQQVRRQTRLVEQRLEREAAMRALEDRFEKIFRASPDAVLISRASDGLIIDANPAFERLSGRPRTAIVGRRHTDLDLWTDPAARAEVLRLLETNGSVGNQECRLRNRDGRDITCVFSAEWIELNGERCRLEVTRDVTEVKRAEEDRRKLQSALLQRQKMESLGTLAGGIAHDFNNILAAILGNAELARAESGVPDEARASLDQILTATLRGRDLVQQILTFSRQQPPDRRHLSLAQVVVEAVRMLRATIPASIEIATELDPDCPPVLADAVQIHQIVMNLGTNAWHAMEDGPGRIVLTLRAVQVDRTLCARHPDLQPGLHAQLSVSDQGTGMTAEIRDRIFEPFFTTKGPGKGTGLGLAAVHGIVKDHQGAIVVESEPGRGSTFIIFLPAAATPPAVSAPELPPQVVARFNRAPVLLIDDEPAVATAIGRMLQRHGFEVARFTRAEEGVAAFRGDPGRFGLIVTDLNMPGMNGLDVATQLRALRHEVPLLLVSGYLTEELRHRAVAAGVDEILQKPISFAELAAVLERLRAREPQQAPGEAG